MNFLDLNLLIKKNETSIVNVIVTSEALITLENYTEYKLKCLDIKTHLNNVTSMKYNRKVDFSLIQHIATSIVCNGIEIFVLWFLFKT